MPASREFKVFTLGELPEGMSTEKMAKEHVPGACV